MAISGSMLVLLGSLATLLGDRIVWAYGCFGRWITGGFSVVCDPVFIELGGTDWGSGERQARQGRGRARATRDVRGGVSCRDWARNHFAFSFHRKCHSLEADLWTNQMIS